MAEASSSTPAIEIPWLSLTDEESAAFSAEIDRLQSVSLVCKVARSRASRGELCDMLQGQLLADARRMVHIQTLGRGYCQIEFKTAQMAASVLVRSLVTIRAARVHFYTWCLVESGFPVSICFPGLKKEYRPSLERIGQLFRAVVGDTTDGDLSNRQDHGPPVNACHYFRYDRLVEGALFPHLRRGMDH